MSEDIVVDIGPETIEYMLKCERLALIDMVKASWFPAHVMRMVFDMARPQGGLLKHFARISLSHPDPVVRAMATEEILHFIPPEELRRHLWA